MSPVISHFVQINNEKITHLSNLAEPENWNYISRESEWDNPKLFYYLCGTIDRLIEENKIMTSETNACFHTGLNTVLLNDIYGLMIPHRERDYAGPAWFLLDFVESNDYRLTGISPLPSKTDYFCIASIDQFLFDPSLEIRHNTEHIILENRDRFPTHISALDDHALTLMFNAALEYTITRIRNNIRLAIPQYYEGRIQLLLPLFFSSRVIADVAAVAQKEDGYYYISTILQLDWAYNNARLISKPDMPWLEP